MIEQPTPPASPEVNNIACADMACKTEETPLSIHIPQAPIFSIERLCEEPESVDDLPTIEHARRLRGNSISSTTSSYDSSPSSSSPSTPVRIRRRYNSIETPRSSVSSHCKCGAVLRSIASTSSIVPPSFASFPSSFSSGSISVRPPFAAAPQSTAEDGKSVLTMDGGGVRGIFAPLFLTELQRHLPEGTDARSLLDLVGGTSTGGVAAILYARLGVSGEQCVKTYEEMPKKLFSKRGKRMRRFWWLFTSAQHSTARQKKLFEKVVGDAVGDVHATLKIDATQDYFANQCPVFVVAVDAQDVSHPKVFTSYEPPYKPDGQEEKAPISIVKAALATSAAPSYYLPTVHEGRSYLDGGMGFNNPSEIAVRQLSKLYGTSAYASTVISLGTGVRSQFPYTHKKKSLFGLRSGITNMFNILSTFALMSTDSESVHTRMTERFEETGAYFRFNPPGLATIALDDWQSVGRARKICEAYLALPETQARIKEVALRLQVARDMDFFYGKS